MDDIQAVNSLVRRCVAGDAAAWQEIVQQYHRRIYNICYRFSGSSDDAADLAQEVFIKMYRTLSTFDTTRASFMTWVTTVTRNLLVDHFRKGKYDRVTDSLDATPGNQDEGLTLAEKLEDPRLARKPGYAARKRRSWCMRLCASFRRNCARRSSCAICRIWITKTLP